MGFVVDAERLTPPALNAEAAGCMGRISSYRRLPPNLNVVRLEFRR